MTINIGMIGLDTSHVVAFTKLLNQPEHDYYVPGGKVTTAFPGGSDDFELSISRVEGYTRELQQDFGVKMVESPEQVAENCDAILLESVDGRVHLEQFAKIAPYGKPVFIDKPLAVSTADALEIVRLSEQHHAPVMSSSALRYAEPLVEAIVEKENIIGADTFGPINFVSTQPGYFWYGIHAVEMLFAAMGSGCKRVNTVVSDDHDIIIGEWVDGRIGVVRGNQLGNNSFGAVIHRQQGSRTVEITAESKPFYASHLEKIMAFFQTGTPAVSEEKTLQIIRFIEAANRSKETGKSITL